MPSIPCQFAIDGCLPCDDFPIVNNSNEAPDQDRFISRFAFLNNIPPIRQYPDFDLEPGAGGIFLQVGCMRWCWSTISQADADLCAARQAVECAFDPLIPGFPIPTPLSPNRIQLFYNLAVTGKYTCPDGTMFFYTIPANQIAGVSQGQINAVALSLANTRAKQHRICLSNLDDPICVDTFYTNQIVATGLYVAVFPATDRWDLVGGSIPPGMMLETGFTSDGITFSGIPTATGQYSFTVRCTISTFGSPGFGDFIEKTFTVKIVGIFDSSPLPDATIGTPYSQQLTATGSAIPAEELWSIVSGSLPDGLTLSQGGLISGTPTGALAGYNFTVEAIFTVGNRVAVCSKQLTITVKATAILAYWTLDESDTGFQFTTRVDSKGGVGLGPLQQVPSQLGKISNCIQLTSTANIASGKILITPITSDFQYSGQDITLTGWVNITTKDIDPGDQFLFDYQLQQTAVGGLLGQFSLCYNPLQDDFVARLEVSGMGVTQLNAGAVIVAGNWYFVQCIYHAATGFTSIRVDNNPIVNGAVSVGTLPSAGFGDFLIQQFPCTFLLIINVDECGAYLRELSISDLDFLYNSGAGETWPATDI
jgi:hypothetical protein